MLLPVIIPELLSHGKLLKCGTGNGKRETGKWKMGTKPNLNPCPISNFIFNFLLCSHFPNSLFPVPKGLSISLCHGERLSPCRRLQVDCWPFWTPP